MSAQDLTPVTAVHEAYRTCQGNHSNQHPSATKTRAGVLADWQGQHCTLQPPNKGRAALSTTNPAEAYMPHSCFMTASTALLPSLPASAAATSALAACRALATPRATSPVLCWSSQRLNCAGDRPERS